jgi:hypothetical protein
VPLPITPRLRATRSHSDFTERSIPKPRISPFDIEVERFESEPESEVPSKQHDGEQDISNKEVIRSVGNLLSINRDNANTGGQVRVGSGLT